MKKPEYEKEKNLIRKHLEALLAQVERENERRKRSEKKAAVLG